MKLFKYSRVLVLFISFSLSVLGGCDGGGNADSGIITATIGSESYTFTDNSIGSISGVCTMQGFTGTRPEGSFTLPTSVDYLMIVFPSSSTGTYSTSTYSMGEMQVMHYPANINICYANGAGYQSAYGTSPFSITITSNAGNKFSGTFTGQLLKASDNTNVNISGTFTNVPLVSSN